MTLYLFPIRNGLTEYNREFNKTLGGLCETYWDMNSTSLCQIGFFATIKRKTVLRKNFINPKILEFLKELPVKVTPTKKAAVKSILKSKRKTEGEDSLGSSGILSSSAEAVTDHSE